MADKKTTSVSARVDFNSDLNVFCMGLTESEKAWATVFNTVYKNGVNTDKATLGSTKVDELESKIKMAIVIMLNAHHLEVTSESAKGLGKFVKDASTATFKGIPSLINGKKPSPKGVLKFNGITNEFTWTNPSGQSKLRVKVEAFYALGIKTESQIGLLA